jgi:hypothetical protein
MGYDTEGGGANGNEKVGQGERGHAEEEEEEESGEEEEEMTVGRGRTSRQKRPAPPLLVSLELGAGTWYGQTRDWIPSLHKDTSLSHLELNPKP